MHMIDAAAPIPLTWWDRRKGQIDAAVIYIGGPRSAGRHSPAYANQLRARGLKLLGCYVGYQAYDINKSQSPEALARQDILAAERAQFDYGMSDCPIAWDFEQAAITDNVYNYLNVVATQWASGRDPKRILYSSASALGHYRNAHFGGYWCARYTENGYTPKIGFQPFHALQYAGNIKWDGANVDISAYDESLFTRHNGGPVAAEKDGATIVSTPSGNGYYVIDVDGGVFCYGDARFYGSLGGKPLNAPIVDAAITPTGNGYWLLGKDNGVFAFGDAPYFGHPGDGK